MTKYHTHVVCLECDNLILNWSNECGGTMFDCDTCGERNEDHVKFVDEPIAQDYDTTTERDLDRELSNV